MNLERHQFVIDYYCCIHVHIMKHIQIGKLGESIARKFLLKHGYTIIGSNMQLSGVEIDLVAQKDKVIYIVEVKTSQYKVDMNSPLDRVNAEKVRRLTRAADWYCRLHTVDVSILIVSVIINTSTKEAECSILRL